MRNASDRSGSLQRIARIAHVAPHADEAAAADVLGADHELVRVLARRRALTVQILVTTLPLALAALGLVRGTASAPAILGAAALVQLALLVAVPYFRTRTREIAEELIASGHHRSLGLRVVNRELRRLTSRRERERIALLARAPAARRRAVVLDPPRPPAAARRPRPPGDRAARRGTSSRSSAPTVRKPAASR